MRHSIHTIAHAPKLKTYVFTHISEDPQILNITVHACNVEAARKKLVVPKGRRKRDYRIIPEKSQLPG